MRFAYCTLLYYEVMKALVLKTCSVLRTSDNHAEPCHNLNSRLPTVSKILRNRMRYGSKSKTGGNPNKRTDTSGAIERGSLFLPRFGKTNAAVPDRIKRLLGGKYAVNCKTAFWITAIADLLA